MSIFEIVVIAILVLCALSGMRRGLVRTLSGFLATLISLMLVNVLLPHTTRLLKEETPVYSAVSAAIDDGILQFVQKNTLRRQDGAIDRDKVRSLMEQYGLDSSQADSLSDGELSKLADQYFSEYKDQITEAVGSSLDSLTRIEQVRMIRSLPIPSFLQETMENYNNKEGYKKLGVTDFSGYISGFISNLLINILAFIVTSLVVWLIIRGVLSALDLFARFPILRQLNRLGGLVVGGIEGVFVCWLLFLIFSALSGTSFGAEVMRQIESSTLLRSLYDMNALLKIVQNSLRGIL